MIVTRKEYLKRRNRLFSLYQVGCLISIKSSSGHVTARRIQINDAKKCRYAKPARGERIYDMYRLISNGTVGIYIGRHGGGACIMIEEGIFRVEVGMIVKIKTEATK
jgi:hypothetical protein